MAPYKIRHRKRTGANQSMPTTKTILSGLETENLVAACTAKDCGQAYSSKQLRNRLLVVTLLDAGLRVGEMCKLQIKHFWAFNAPVNSLIIPPEFTKTKTERCVPCSLRLTQTIILCRQYLWPRDSFDETDYAFTIRPHGRKITTRQAERVVRSLSLQAIGRAVHPHLLRHTFATNLLRITNIRVVQELMGHKSIKSTQVYTHPNHDDLKDAINKLETNNVTAFVDNR